jgi:hypothetical protein
MKNLFTLIFTLMMLSGYSQIYVDSSFTISGSVDTYFRTNLNSTNDVTNGGTIAPGTSFANLPGFSLGMFNIVSAYEGKKVGFTADLVFGPRGVDAVFVSEGSTNIVNQLFVYWNVSDKLKLTIGNFNTFLGYEVISPVANFNYSTSYMFSYGPFSHTGLKADVDLGGGFSLMGAVLNPTDFTDFNPFGTDALAGGLQLGYTNDNGGVWINTIISDDFYQIDLTTGWQATEKVYVGVNATTAKESFSGAALYLQLATSDALSVGIRGEYFIDSGVGVVDFDMEDDKDESVFDITLSANYKVGKLTIIPEFRLDAFSQDIVIPDFNKITEVKSSLASFVLAAVYAF